MLIEGQIVEFHSHGGVKKGKLVDKVRVEYSLSDTNAIGVDRYIVILESGEIKQIKPVSVIKVIPSLTTEIKPQLGEGYLSEIAAQLDETSNSTTG